MKYYVCMYFKCISKKGDTFYSTISFECSEEFTNEMHNELIEFIKEASGKALKQDIVECETVSKEEYDEFEKESKVIEVHLSEGQE